MHLRSDDSGMELPINIVVMVVVGLAALSALLLMIPKPTLQMSATVTGVDAEADGSPGTYQDASILVLRGSPKESWVKAKVHLADPKGGPVGGASCFLRGLGTVVTSKALGGGDYEFDGSAGDKMKVAGVSEGELYLTCDAPGHFKVEGQPLLKVLVAG